MMKNKKIMSGLFAIVLVMSVMCFNGAHSDVAYANDDVVTAETPQGVDYIVEKHTKIDAYRTKNADGYYTSPSITATDITNATNEWVFAGWYTSAACTDTLKKGTVSGEGYAKFVSADVLSVRCQISTDTQPESPSTLLRCISSVDTLKYSKVGFDLITPSETKYMESSTVGTRIQVTEDKASNPCNYSPKVVDTESEYFYSAVEEIQQEDFDDGFLVKPYWITKDGTKVYGVSRYVTINEAVQHNVIYVPVKKSAEPTVETTFTVDGNAAEYITYDVDGGYAHLKLSVADTNALASVTKYTITGGDEAESPYYYRNLNTKYTGSNADQTWVTAYDGSSEDEFVIATSADFYGLTVLTNSTNQKTFEGNTIYLCADIEANKGRATEDKWDTQQTADGTVITDGSGTANPWSPIGAGALFTGVFDGQGHTISGIYFNSSGIRTALFAWNAPNSTIQNFNLINSYINNTRTTGDAYTGSILGRCDGSVCNVYSDAIVKSGGQYNGGIAGMIWGTTIRIENCSYDGNIDTSGNGSYTGGIIGVINKGTVTLKNCSFNGEVGSIKHNIGAIIGGINAAVTVTMENCLSSGSVIVTGGGDSVGGLVGRIHHASATLNMVKCLNMGEVKGDLNVGSAIGWAQKGTVDVASVYATTDNCTGTSTTGLVIATRGEGTNTALVTMTGEPVGEVTLDEITVSDSATAEMIRNTTLSGLFGTDSIWTIGTAIGSTPELIMTTTTE